MNPLVAHEALQELTSRVLELAPEGAAGVHLRVSVVGSFARYQKWSIGADGAETGLAVRTPALLGDYVQTLRAASARPGVGTWFTADIAVRHDGEISARYNYDDEPDFGPVGATAENFTEELAQFPRAVESIPDWLRRRLDVAN